MYDYVIIHGSYGHPFENWEPWLFNVLTSEGKQVLAPQFPCIDQNYENWKRVLDAYKPCIGEKTSFIGHSLGPAFIVDYLIDEKIKINNLYLAAPFYGFIGIENFDTVNQSFFKHSDISKAGEFFNKAICLYSDNDPYVPIEMSKEISKLLNAKQVIIPNKGHLNAGAGMIEFKELKKEIEMCIRDRASSEYGWYSFIKEQGELKTELYSFVSALAASNIVKQALFFAGETAADYSDLHVYLDSPIVFALLGMDDPSRTESYQQLVADMRTARCSVHVLDHNFNEVDGIITRADVYKRQM